MELLTWGFFGAMALCGTVIVHLIASDLHDEIPRWAERLVRLAAKLLPRVRQQRYQEEWLAHLTECRGAFSKLWHAVGCLLCAGPIGREMYAATRLEFDFDLPGIRVASLQTNLHEMWILLLLQRLCLRTRATRRVFIRGACILLCWRVFTNVRQRTGLPLMQFVRLVRKTKSSDWDFTSVIIFPGGDIPFAVMTGRSASLVYRASLALTDGADAGCAGIPRRR
jgi:hypothetical protein